MNVFEKMVIIEETFPETAVIFSVARDAASVILRNIERSSVAISMTENIYASAVASAEAQCGMICC